MMKFTSIPFGNCSGPFLPNATVQFHLSGFPVLRVVEELKQNMYVDDFCQVLILQKNALPWCEKCNQYHVTGEHAFS